MLPINQQQLAPWSIFSQNKQATSISIMLVLLKMDMTQWTSLASKSIKDHMFELLLCVCLKQLNF